MDSWAAIFNKNRRDGCNIGLKYRYERQPAVCNLCGGKVELMDNMKVYGERRGSGYTYICTQCGARIGTHINSPDIALGILSNEEMRRWKVKCHNRFDALWKNQERYAKSIRADLYYELSRLLGIPEHCCHFGHFDSDMLKEAYEKIGVLEQMRERGEI